MASRIAIVTDSTADLAPDVAAASNVTVVPLHVSFGGQEFRDGIDLSVTALMKQMAASSELPVISHPASEAFEELFRHLASNHDEVLVITLSSRLGETFQSAQLAAEAVVDLVAVTVIDSATISVALGCQALHASEMARTGASVADIQAALAAEADLYETVLFVDGLDHLRKGDRIGKATQLLGTMLQLRPLLRVEEGQIVPFERTRTRSRAISALVDFVRDADAISEVTVLYTSTPEDAQSLAEQISEAIGLASIPTVQVGPVIAAHLGPGTLGVSLKELPNV